jgi:hypothetical protein
MSNASKPKTSFISRTAWMTGIACVACCAIPLIGIAMGSAAVAGLSLYSEKAAFVVAVAGVAVVLFRRFTRQQSPSCNLDGSCGPGKADTDKPEGP